MNALKHRVERLLAEADIEIGGDHAWDIQVHDDSLYSRILIQGSLGLGEGYMDGDWDANALDGFLFRLLDARLDLRAHSFGAVRDALRARLLNLQAKRRSFTVGERHYDLTLQAWRENIERAWPTLDERYDERFRRMWRYYLTASMAVFRSRRAQLWQLVLSPHGVSGGYLAPR